MRIQPLVAISVLAAAGLAGCGSGDIKLAPSTSVNNSNNSTTNNPPNNNPPAANPCASYVNGAGQTVQGSYDGTNCAYSPSFVDAGNNLKYDMTIPDLPNDGVHIFQGSLFVGESYSTNAEMSAANIAEGGDGPTLTIDAGATLAFSSSAQFMVINRGSQIFAVGRPDAPITLTSVTDVQDSLTDPLAVQQWGGLVINGFGVTNACEYTGVLGSATTPLQLTGECHVDSEGSAGLDENQYGGNNNDDSSGRMEYLVVKHTGATVGNGDELNGITFGAVGRNTIVRNVEVYSVYDDGLEFFGGAVNVENYVGMYVRDDSLDFDEGYQGTITNALIIQTQNDGGNCIESDGIADFGDLDATQRQAVADQGINSRPTVDHMTCIFSQHPASVGTHDAGAGIRLREGIFATITNSLLIGSFMANNGDSATDNYCLRIDDELTRQGALNGSLNLASVIYSCAERTNSGSAWADGTTTTEGFATAEGNVFANVTSGQPLVPTAAAASGLQLLEGTEPFYSIAFASSQVNGAAPPASVTPTDGSAFLGAVSTSATDWTQGWTFGLHDGSRDIPVWID